MGAATTLLGTQIMRGGKLEALVVDRESSHRDGLTALLEKDGLRVRTVTTAAHARDEMAARPADILLTDAQLPDGEGVALVREFPQQARRSVLMSWQATVALAVDALRAGIRHFVQRPVDPRQMRSLLGRLIADARGAAAHDVTTPLGAGRFRLAPMLGSAPAMRQIYALIQRVAPTSASMVITGESGTGKELAARAIHAESGRPGPFLAVNCGALSATLVESELFGHERGAFTGAFQRHRGYFERAALGTLFLDEITEMPPELQVKLLRVLETGQVLRLGGDEPQAVDVRIIAATNRVLSEAVESQRLRLDLYYRLGSFVVSLPPLRDRRSDIALLAHAFLDELNQRFDRAKRLQPQALHRLETHSWPGNVRELRNVMERAYIIAEDEIGLEELQFDPPPRCVGLTLEEAQRQLILETLAQYDGDKPRAARVLGISLKTLYNRLHQYARETPEVEGQVTRRSRRRA